jgi:hypothetical protein
VIVGGSLALAVRADGLGVFPWDDLDFDDWMEVFPDQADLLVNKGLDRVNDAE